MLDGSFGASFWQSGGCWGSTVVQFETAMAASYGLSIVTIALFLIIRRQFAIKCLRCSN